MPQSGVLRVLASQGIPVQRAAAIAVTLSLLVVALSGSAIALSRPADFAPFTMTITAWSDSIGSTEPGVVVPGTIVTRLEYVSVREWTATTVSHSLDRNYEGTVRSVRNQERSLLDALTRMTSVSAGDGVEVPDRWLIPDLIEHLPRRGFVSTSGPAPGTVVFTKVETIGAPVTRDGQTGATHEVVTRAVFDTSSGLPVSVEAFVDGTLRSSMRYVVTSRP